MALNVKCHISRRKGSKRPCVDSQTAPVSGGLGRRGPCTPVPLSSLFYNHLFCPSSDLSPLPPFFFLSLYYFHYSIPLPIPSPPLSVGNLINQICQSHNYFGYRGCLISVPPSPIPCHPAHPQPRSRDFPSEATDAVAD